MKIKEEPVRGYKEETARVGLESVKADIAITFKNLSLSSKTLWTKTIQ